MRWRLIILSSQINDKYFHDWFSQPFICFQSWDLILLRHQFRRYVEHLFECEIRRVHNGVTIVLLKKHEYCWFHCYSHKHSPNPRMFFSIFCNIRNCFLSFSHLIIDPIHEWSWFYWQFQFCFIVSVPNGLRGFVEKNFLVRVTRSNFSYHSPRSFIRSPRSVVCLSISFPSTLEKTKRGHHPTLKNLLKKNFPLIVHDNSNQKLSIGPCRYQVVPILPLSQQLYFRILIFFPWSIFCNNKIPRIVFSAISLLRAYWSRGWYVRRHPCNKIHHWSRLCCESFFSWTLLRSFRHCIRAHCRTEIGWYWTSTTNDSTHHVWNFPWSACLRVGFWCRCIWFGFWDPE